VLVPTVESTRLLFLAGLLKAQQRRPLLCGGSGGGKTAAADAFLKKEADRGVGTVTQTRSGRLFPLFVCFFGGGCGWQAPQCGSEEFVSKRECMSPVFEVIGTQETSVETYFLVLHRPFRALFVLGFRPF
jgi:hypothetical protein